MAHLDCFRCNLWASIIACEDNDIELWHGSGLCAKSELKLESRLFLCESVVSVGAR